MKLILGGAAALLLVTPAFAQPSADSASGRTEQTVTAPSTVTPDATAPSATAPTPSTQSATAPDTKWRDGTVAESKAGKKGKSKKDAPGTTAATDSSATPPGGA